MGSLSTLTINFECLEHKLRWGGPRAPVALCSVACWDIFADWAQLKHPWSVFTRLELLKAYLRWKKKKMRGNTQVGKKSWLPHWGGGVQRDLGSCVMCLLSFDPRVDSLSLSRPSCSSVSLTGNRGMSVYKASGSTFTRFPLPLWINMIICFFPNFLIEHTRCGRPQIVPFQWY